MLKSISLTIPSMSTALKRYDIKETIAEGGLGAVYIAHDTKLKRDVAIKRLHTTEGISAEEMHESLMKESRILSQLNSPNIVSIFDVDKEGDESFVVMELLNGDTLEEVVKRAPLLEKDFLSVVEQSLEGIISAHSGGLIHSDLKPENFMITWWPSGRFQLKLLDFGISTYANAAAEKTQKTTELLGSIFFMAPEQFKKQPIDQRTDIYSLGCVFYYALTGKYPFDGDTTPQVMASHLQSRVEPIQNLRPELDPRLAELVNTMIRKDPDERFQSAMKVFEEVREIQKTPPPQYVEEVATVENTVYVPRPQPVLASSQKKVPTLYVLFGITGVVILVIVIAAVVMLKE